MNGQLLDFIATVKSKADQFKRYDEIETKQAMILPVLQFLGWNVWDTEEVKPEHPVEGKKAAEGGRVDYCLKIKKKSEYFLEIKRPSEDLEKHQEQLLDYSFREGIDIAVLSNGMVWWFYLPRKKGHWKERKFYAIDIGQQGAEEICEKFIQLLAMQNVQSGEALKNAEFILKERDRKKKITETLPKAWNKVVGEYDPTLVNLLAETTESMCGFRPEGDDIEEMIRENKEILLLQSQPKPSILTRPPSQEERKELHRLGSQGAKIDSAIFALLDKGGSVTAEAVSKIVNMDVSRVRGHIRHLEMDHAWKGIIQGKPEGKPNYDHSGKSQETPTQELRQHFFEGLIQKTNTKTNLFSKISPNTVNSWINAGIGRSGITLLYSILKDKSRVELGIYSPDIIKNKAIFDALYKQKDEIEKEIGFPLDWVRMDEKITSVVRKRFDEGGLNFPDKWPELQEKMSDAMVKFEKAFLPRLNSID